MAASSVLTGIAYVTDPIAKFDFTPESSRISVVTPKNGGTAKCNHTNYGADHNKMYNKL